MSISLYLNTDISSLALCSMLALHAVYPSAQVRQGYNLLPKNRSSIMVLIISLWDIELTEHDIDRKTVGPQYT